MDAKFKELSLGLVDGTVAALAERRKIYRVLTTDRRDFSTVRIGPRFTQVLELIPLGALDPLQQLLESL